MLSILNQQMWELPQKTKTDLKRHLTTLEIDKFNNIGNRLQFVYIIFKAYIIAHVKGPVNNLLNY